LYKIGKTTFIYTSGVHSASQPKLKQNCFDLLHQWSLICFFTDRS